MKRVTDQAVKTAQRLVREGMSTEKAVNRVYAVMSANRNLMDVGGTFAYNYVCNKLKSL